MTHHNYYNFTTQPVRYCITNPTMCNTVVIYGRYYEIPQKACERYIFHVMSYAFFKCPKIENFHFFLSDSENGEMRHLKTNIEKRGF